VQGQSVALADVLQAPEPASCMIDNKKVRMFFWGLTSEPKWPYALPLANAIPKASRVDKEWTHWRVTALRECVTDERLQRLIHSANSTFSYFKRP
jgi:hypothetical protein